MKKERFKSILLVFLVLTDVVLGSKILIDKKLWPDGYNFFSNMGIFYSNIMSYFSDNSKQKAQVFSPESIIINTGDQTTRTSLTSNNDEFEELYSEAQKLIKSAFSSERGNIETINKETLTSALSADSVFLNYPFEYDVSLFSALLGLKSSAVSEFTDKLSQVVITLSSRPSVYVANLENNDYIKINISADDKKLASLCSECTNKYTDNSVINYSFELKFDQPFGTQKTTLNPLIRIYSTENEYPVITSANPILNNDNTINETIIDNILKAFNINPSTMRRYTEAGGTIVFVENDGILKIDTNGYLEYQATGRGKEISTSNNFYADIMDIASLVIDVNSAAFNNASVRLSGHEDNELYFDYVVSGLEMRIDNTKADAAVVAKIESGYLKSYRQLIRSYQKTPEKLPPPGFFTALDSTIDEYSQSMNEIRINNMYIGYTDNGSVGTKQANWIVEVDNVIAVEP